MYRSHNIWQLGIPHTICGALSEVALFAQAAHLHWQAIGTLTECLPSRLIDAAGQDVYASVYFAEFGSEDGVGLARFRPDDEIELVGTLGRYGASMLDGVHYLYPADPLRPAPADQPTAASFVRLSFIMVSTGRGVHALRISTPANADVERIPSLPREPDSYRIVKEAQAAGKFSEPPAGARRLWSGEFSYEYPVNPDRDLNGVGLLYFANYIAFMDAAERAALQERAGFVPERLDGRVTLRRRIAYYGNAQSTDRLQIAVEAFAPAGEPDGRLFVQHRVRRVSDGRLVAVSGSERRLRRRESGEAIE